MNLPVFLLEAPLDGTAGAAMQIVNNPIILIAGIALIVIAIALVLFIKQIIINSILGVIALGIIHFVFHIELPLLPAIVVSAIFGLIFSSQ